MPGLPWNPARRWPQKRRSGRARPGVEGPMLSAALLLFANSLLFSLRLSSGGSFPKPLSAAEEREWLRRYADGDPEARQVLIERNLRLVAHIIKKYYTQNGDQEDLISIGTIGLIKGVSSFDPSKGARLATYAARCIENAILSKRPTPPPVLPNVVPRKKHGPCSAARRSVW